MPCYVLVILGITSFHANTMALELYFSPNDESCKKIMKLLKLQHLPYISKDISGDLIHLQKLLQITGSKKVPCLFVDGNPLQGETEIQDWINQNFGRVK